MHLFKSPQHSACKAYIALIASMLLSTHSVFAAESSDAPQKIYQDLEFGTVLYDFYQRDYFAALINHEYATKNKNTQAKSDHGQVLRGGMLLSFGAPNAAKPVFDRLLDQSESEQNRNAAWYYLAKLFYSKSDPKQAKQALQQIQGKISDDLHIDYHYLSTLIHENGHHLENSKAQLEKIKKDLPQYPYFLFNNAIRALNNGNAEQAKALLNEVKGYNYLGEEYAVLSDRAKHGLSQLSGREGKLLEAWQHLTGIRTTGLYSNRALLSYAWATIKLKRFKKAIPALEILDSRSIALPEVQEAKVLLAHLYEQDGALRHALKQNIRAEKEFTSGLGMLQLAREIIALQDVPKEFISNLDKIVRESDWYGERPEVDYNNLTPFLIDLLAANSFNETLRELADLYSIEENLEYWQLQQDQHLLILKERKSKKFTQQSKKAIANGKALSERFANSNTELKLLLLALDEKDQERFSTLLESTQEEINKLTQQINRLQKIESPYSIPDHYSNIIREKKKDIQSKLSETRRYIAKLEVVVRALVNVELDKHESRMQYYAAQAKLAKARLYDATLLNLDSAKKRVNTSKQSTKKNLNGDVQ